MEITVSSKTFAEQFEQFKLYCFLYLLGLSPLLGSVGKYLVSSGKEEKFNPRQLLTPPFIANILAVIIVLSGARGIVPGIVLEPVSLLGSATVPIGMFILGAVLGSVHLRLKPYISDALRVLPVKLIIIPALTITVLHLTGFGQSYPVLAGLLILQASSAPAAGLMIQIRHYGGNEQELSSILLLSYLFCIVTIPFWFAVWTMLSAAS